MVYKGARSAGTGTVHALLHAAGHIRNLGVFAAQFDNDVGFGNALFYRRCRSDDFLYKRNGKPMRHGKPARPGYADAQALRFLCGVLFFNTVQCVADYGYNCGTNIGAMSLVLAEYDFGIRIQCDDLYGRRAYIYT